LLAVQQPRSRSGTPESNGCRSARALAELGDERGATAAPAGEVSCADRSVRGLLDGRALLSLSGQQKSYWRRDVGSAFVSDAVPGDRRPESSSGVGQAAVGQNDVVRIARVGELTAARSASTARDLSTLSNAPTPPCGVARSAWCDGRGRGVSCDMLDYVALPLLVEHGRRKANRLPTSAQRVGDGQ